ncbi:centriole and centriolar satellite protein OFD1 isoform X1 [Myiozetetes cayanensis]|uniref:centriole and centriolar satellite protein OFD1 isoform X1 n=2 Tax=Myiozetetes cayanensis TaxID=478635 RepID=UPI00215FB813|nr:centriole and centriolar satellite protein OFD1 isoform X1 [Myiozetetes cayanensis]XP_050187864.1 centriole and centriolar satellite protein OFD1 isoform X1 [Myiozetetes cayanensis]
MASVEREALSQEELRKRLYQTFKSRGVLDTLKTQLRNQLIHELMHPILSGELQPQTVPSNDSSLLITASNSLVADHLERCGYEYSLSVFFPESGLEKKKLWTMQDLLHLMRISPKSSFYKSLTSGIQKENKGFLMQILIGLTEHHLNKETHNTETQTTSVPPYRESLAEKLQLIDEQFADSYPQHQKYESLEVKLHEYRKEIEKQLQAEMHQKLEHFKEVEIAKIKMEEKVQTQKEISELRHELEKTHQAKSEALISREKNAIERLQKQQEIEAKEVYAQRQSLLKDIEAVRTREAELKERMEAFELTQKLQEEKNKAIDDALRRREVAVKNIEETYDQRLKTELLKYELELKEEYIARTNKVTEDEKKNKEKAMLLHEEAVAVNSKKEELKQAVSRTKELELDLESVKAQMVLANKQNQLLTEKLKELSDYPLLKEEKLELQVQNKLLRQQLDEARSENQHLRDKLSQPSAEYLACQVELRRVEHSRKLVLDEFESRKQILEKQLQSKVERCAQLETQLLESEATVRKLNMQVEELKLQVKQTQAALENEVYRNPKPSLVDRSVLDFTSDRAVPHDIYMDSAFLRNHVVTDGMQVNAVPRAGCRQQLQPRSASPDSDLEYIAQTWARVKELSKEAEYLEEAYRNYQHRVIQNAAASRTPRKMESPLILQRALGGPPLTTQHEFVEDNPSFPHSPLSSPRGEEHIKRTGQADIFKNPLTPPHRGASSSRRLSSTPISKSKRDLSNKKIPDDIKSSSLTSSQRSVDQVLSPISKPYLLSSSESVPSSPSSHAQKIRLQSQQTDKQDLSDMHKPKKLTYEDLEEHIYSLEDQGDMPEECENDALHPSGDIVNGNCVTAPVPATATSLQDLMMLDQRQIEEQNREAEENLKEETKAREERREREQQEALEREQEEVEKLNEDMYMQDSITVGEEKEDKEGVKSVNSNSGTEDHVKDPPPNPLEKYMRIIQQSREQNLSNKDSKKEEIGEVSHSEGLLSSEKDDSVADISHGDMDESFW